MSVCYQGLARRSLCLCLFNQYDHVGVCIYCYCQEQDANCLYPKRIIVFTKDSGYNVLAIHAHLHQFIPSYYIIIKVKDERDGEDSRCQILNECCCQSHY
jgi:hypothetical protein